MHNYSDFKIKYTVSMMLQNTTIPLQIFYNFSTKKRKHSPYIIIFHLILLNKEIIQEKKEYHTKYIYVSIYK